MAEAGVPESTMLALMGHMSRAILERYSHVGMAAKRAAPDALTLDRVAHPQEIQEALGELSLEQIVSSQVH